MNVEQRLESLSYKSKGARPNSSLTVSRFLTSCLESTVNSGHTLGGSIKMTNFDDTARAREMARWTRCLPYKHEDLHSHLQNTNKKDRLHNTYL